MTWSELLAVYRHALRLAALGDLEADAWTTEFQSAVGLEDLKVRQARLCELEASASRAWLHPAEPEDLAAEP